MARKSIPISKNQSIKTARRWINRNRLNIAMIKQGEYVHPSVRKRYAFIQENYKTV